VPEGQQFRGVGSLLPDQGKRRDTPNDLLLRPLEQGLPVKIGAWCFRTMFDLEGQSESMTKPYFKQLGKEDFLWFLDDVVEAARLSRFFKEEALLNVIGTRINNIDALLASNENAYWDEVERAGRRELTNMFKQLCKSQQGPRPKWARCTHMKSGIVFCTTGSFVTS
jgi:hypothetical protein